MQPQSLLHAVSEVWIAVYFTVTAMEEVLHVSAALLHPV